MSVVSRFSTGCRVSKDIKFTAGTLGCGCSSVQGPEFSARWPLVNKERRKAAQGFCIH